MKQENSAKTNLEIFAHNVAWLRKHYGFSKSKMARIMRIGIPSLNKLERGEIPPRLGVDVLFAIQKQFGICPSEQCCRWLEGSSSD